MIKIYVVEVTSTQREHLQALTRSEEMSARRWRRARTLLLADRGRPEGERPDSEIASALSCCVRTVEPTRKRFAEDGMEAALSGAPRPGRTKKLDASEEALMPHEAVSRELVRHRLKKTP